MTAAYTLRDYQEAAVVGARGEFSRRHRRVLIVMPTGAGKTLTASDMVGGVDRKGKRTLWLTDRGELAEQASAAFDLAGVPHSYILRDTDPDRFGRAHVGTIQSFLARVKREKWVPGRVDLIVIDEAHRAEASSFQQVLDLFPDAYVVGLTATPMRGDGRGLGNTFEAQIVPVTMAELLARGVLVPARYFIPSELDFSKVQRKRGEYSAADLEALAESNPQLIGDVVENFARICPERRAVAFPMTIAHSVALRDAFNAAGIPACHVDGHMPKGERKRVMSAFRAGEYQVLTSVNIAVEGLDVPDVSAVILARPTKSERIWVQAVGRGLRSFPGKEDCIVLDHASVLLRFGPAEDFVPPELHDRDGKKNEGQERKKKEAKPYPCENEACCAVLIGTNVCPECGHVHEFEQAPEALAVEPGQLEELTAEGRRKAAYDLAQKKRWYGELLGYCLNKGSSAGRAYHLFREKFGDKPEWAWKQEVLPVPPSPEVLAWVKSRNIAWWKAQEKARRANAAD